MFHNVIFNKSRIYTENAFLTRSLRKPNGPCTKSMEVSESRMERVKPACFYIAKTQFNVHMINKSYAL